MIDKKHLDLIYDKLHDNICFDVSVRLDCCPKDKYNNIDCNDCISYVLNHFQNKLKENNENKV